MSSGKLAHTFSWSIKKNANSHARMYGRVSVVLVLALVLVLVLVSFVGLFSSPFFQRLYLSITFFSLFFSP